MIRLTKIFVTEDTEVEKKASHIESISLYATHI